MAHHHHHPLLSTQFDWAWQRFERKRGPRLELLFRGVSLTPGSVRWLQTRLTNFCPLVVARQQQQPQRQPPTTPVSLRFDFCEFQSNDTIQELAQLLRNTALHVIALSLVHCDNVNYDEVVTLLRASNRLREFQFSVEHKLVGVMAALSECHNVEKLVLLEKYGRMDAPQQGTQIDDSDHADGRKELGRGLSGLQSLKVLHFHYSCSDETLSILVHSLQALEPRLERLDLSLQKHLTGRSLLTLASLLDRHSKTKTTLCLTISNCHDLFSNLDNSRFIEAFLAALEQSSARIHHFKLQRVGITRDVAQKLFSALTKRKSAGDGMNLEIVGVDLFSSALDGCFQKDKVFQGLLSFLSSAPKLKALMVEDSREARQATKVHDKERDQLLCNALRRNSRVSRVFFWVNGRNWLSTEEVRKDIAAIYQRNECFVRLKQHLSRRARFGEEHNRMYTKMLPFAIKAFANRAGSIGRADIVFEMLRSEVGILDWARLSIRKKRPRPLGVSSN